MVQEGYDKVLCPPKILEDSNDSDIVSWICFQSADDDAVDDPRFWTRQN